MFGNETHYDPSEVMSKNVNIGGGEFVSEWEAERIRDVRAAKSRDEEFWNRMSRARWRKKKSK